MNWHQRSWGRDFRPERVANSVHAQGRAKELWDSWAMSNAENIPHPSLYSALGSGTPNCFCAQISTWAPVGFSLESPQGSLSQDTALRRGDLSQGSLPVLIVRILSYVRMGQNYSPGTCYSNCQHVRENEGIIPSILCHHWNCRTAIFLPLLITYCFLPLFLPLLCLCIRI